MHRLVPVVFFVLFFATLLRAQGLGLTGVRSNTGRDARALAVAVIDALGGLDAWNDRSWDIAFDFVIERGGNEAARFSHIWKRATSEYLVSGKTREGKTWRVYFEDIYAKRGTATINGEPAPDTLLPKLLDLGYGRFINDSYWLMMPFKLLDSGVILSRLPDTTLDGRFYNVLHLSFQNVGLTPGDQYWLYIDPATKRIERWRYLLQSGREGDYLWQEYRQLGPITLPLYKVTPDNSAAIRFDNVRVGTLSIEP